MAKRTEITIETSRRLIVRPQLARRATGWCDGCETQVEVITPNEAAALLNVSPRAIYRWIEDAQLHFIEDARGSVLICALSLSLARQQATTQTEASTNRLKSPAVKN